jgi:hypothetical protein
MKRAVCISLVVVVLFAVGFSTGPWDSLSRLFLNELNFNTDYSGTPSEGRMFWDSTAGTVSVGMPGGEVNLQVGQEMFLPRRVKNKSGVDMKNGQLVYMSGGSGVNVYVTLARADAHDTAHPTIAMLTEDIDDNATGYATTFGLVRGSTAQPINTSAYDPGDVLYLDPSTAGAFTGTMPVHPNYVVTVGQVFRKHASEGSIVAKIGAHTTASEIAGGDDIVYDDIQVGISNIRIPVANAPTERLYAGGIGSGVTFPFLGFAVNDYIYFDVQTSHSMLISSMLDQHIHYLTPTDGTGSRFQFQLDVIVSPIGGTWSAPTGTPFTAEKTMTTDDSTTQKYFEIAEIPASNTTVSTVYKCKLTRIAATQDEYAGEVYLTGVDAHYQKDSLGSRSETSKD